MRSTANKPQLACLSDLHAGSGAVTLSVRLSVCLSVGLTGD